ncbi:MAG: DUF7793 family protein [Bacteroidia bacterium]
MTISAPAEDNYSKIYLEGNILHCIIKNKNLDIAAAEAMVNLRLSYTNGQAYPVFIDASKVKSVTKEARDYFSGEHATSLVKAAAILAPSLVVRLLANFFLSFDKPKVNTRVFSSSAEAIAWLKHYI